jgi:LPS export ABC transporter protein LptC
MIVKKSVKIYLIFSTIFILILFFYLNLNKQIENKEIKVVEEKTEDTSYNSNIINDVKYTSKDADGNEYTITALVGEIDFSDTDILFLTKVRALINLNNSENVTITSDYGKYNSKNLDTIFSKNVIINYLENKITGEYLDFSLKRNSMIISRNVIYTNLENILNADVIELNIKTKDTKIFMYEDKKKVNIKSKN